MSRSVKTPELAISRTAWTTAPTSTGVLSAWTAAVTIAMTPADTHFGQRAQLVPSTKQIQLATLTICAKTFHTVSSPLSSFASLSQPSSSDLQTLSPCSVWYYGRFHTPGFLHRELPPHDYRLALPILGFCPQLNHACRAPLP